MADALAQQEVQQCMGLLASSHTTKENGDDDHVINARSSSSKTHADTEIKTQTGKSAETTLLKDDKRNLEVEVAQTQVDETMPETQLVTQPMEAPATTKETPAEDMKVEDNKPSTAQTEAEETEETVEETQEKEVPTTAKAVKVEVEVDLPTALATSAAGSAKRTHETTPSVLPNGKEPTMDNIVEYFRSQAQAGVDTWKENLELFVADLQEHEQQSLFKGAKSHALLATHVAETSDDTKLDDWGVCPEQACEEVIEFFVWLVPRGENHQDKNVGNKFSTEHRLFQLHMKIVGKDFQNASVTQIESSQEWTLWSSKSNKYTGSLVNHCEEIQKNYKDLFATFKEFMIIDCDLDSKEWVLWGRKIV